MKESCYTKTYREFGRKDDFGLGVDPFYSEEHIAMLERRVADLKAGKNLQEHELIDL